MPEIMNAHVVETGARPDAPPRMLEVGEMGTGLPARDHPGIVLVARQGFQQSHRRWRQRNRPAARLRVGQVQLAGFEVDVLPAQLLDFREPAAGEHQQADRRDRRAGLRAVLEDVVENLAEALELLGAQEPLPLFLLEPLDVQAGVRAVGTETPDLGHVEHLGEHAEGAVGLVGRLAHTVVQCGDVAPLDFGHLAAADFGLDEEVDGPPVFVGRAGLAMRGDVFLQEARPEDLHGRRPPVGVPLRGRVSTGLGFGKQGHRAPARLFRGEGGDGSEGHTAEPAVGAELANEELAPGRPDAQAETRQLAVPVEAVGPVALDAVDGAFGDLDLRRHGASRVYRRRGS